LQKSKALWRKKTEQALSALLWEEGEKKWEKCYCHKELKERISEYRDIAEKKNSSASESQENKGHFQNEETQEEGESPMPRKTRRASSYLGTGGRYRPSGGGKREEKRKTTHMSKGEKKCRPPIESVQSSNMHDKKRKGRDEYRMGKSIEKESLLKNPKNSRRRPKG